MTHISLPQSPESTQAHLDLPPKSLLAWASSSPAPSDHPLPPNVESLPAPHQQSSEASRLLQLHLNGAQPHFSCVHWFGCLPPGAHPFGYGGFTQFSGLLLPLSQHTHSLYEHLNQTPLWRHTGSVHPLWDYLSENTLPRATFPWL